jgi:hypothetical protein
MSTKTLRKRISLVAVSALGFGMLSVLAAPSANAEAAFSVISVGTVPAARAGATVTIPVTVSISSHAASETMTIAAKVISAPTGSAFASDALGPNGTNHVNSATYPWFAFGDSDGTLAANTGTTITSGTTADATSYIGRHIAGTTAAGDLAAAGVGGVLATAIRATLDSTANTSTTATFYLNVKPDVAGSYSFLISTSGVAAHGSYVAGDTSTTMTLTTAGAPATATIAAVGGSNATNGTGSKGALFKVTFKDAAGLATTLGGDEAFTVTASAGYIAKASLSAGVFTSANPTALTSISFGASDLYNGNGFFNANVSTAATTVVLNGAGAGALSSAITASASYATATGLAASTTAAQTTTFAGRGGTAVTSGWYTTGGNFVPTTTTSNTIELTYTGETTANYGYLTVTDTNGLISGIGTASSLAYDRAYTQAAMTTAGADYTTVAIPHALCANGITCYAVTDSGGSTIGNVVGQTSSTGSSAFGVTVYGPATTLTSATAGSVTYTVRMRDQFKLGVANTGIAVTFAGRNSAKASPTIVTDASGYATYTFTDTGTTGTTDVLTFTSGTKSATATINYGTATAGSVLVATPSTGAVTSTTVAGVDSYPRAYSEISAGDGVEAGAVTVTALVKDANANVMAGMPVVWTVTGAGCAITSTTSTSYTAANGQATASLYGWIAGNCVVKATSGGQSDEANSYWAQTGTAEVRSISATVTGGSIVVVAKDRLGNTIAGVPLKATRTSGSGSFGGSSSATGTTDAAGSQEFIISNGDANVTVTFNDAAASTYGQSDALKGLIDGTSTAAANLFTAYTAGTTLLDEEGVGASFDAAGVNSVTVTVTGDNAAQAAADAAAEATDAANAATDAANAAAEAADAATAAAQDAADAVAALSTQVSEMVNALKKQITALTNLVIKIQKKVRA